MVLSISWSLLGPTKYQYRCIVSSGSIQLRSRSRGSAKTSPKTLPMRLSQTTAIPTPTNNVKRPPNRILPASTPCAAAPVLVGDATAVALTNVPCLSYAKHTVGNNLV